MHVAAAERRGRQDAEEAERGRRAILARELQNRIDKAPRPVRRATCGEWCREFLVLEPLARTPSWVMDHDIGAHELAGVVALEHVDLGGGLVLTGTILTRDGVPVNLTPTELGILRELAWRAGRVIRRAELLRLVWGPAYESERHLLRVNMSRLRAKIGYERIETQVGIGYRLLVQEARL